MESLKRGVLDRVFGASFRGKVRARRPPDLGSVPRVPNKVPEVEGRKVVRRPELHR